MHRMLPKPAGTGWRIGNPSPELSPTAAPCWPRQNLILLYFAGGVVGLTPGVTDPWRWVVMVELSVASSWRA